MRPELGLAWDNVEVGLKMEYSILPNSNFTRENDDKPP
jgi:hypothetical protein